jgi:hypothetical protein
VLPDVILPYPLAVGFNINLPQELMAEYNTALAQLQEQGVVEVGVRGPS